jgi:hypothetical protein
MRTKGYLAYLGFALLMASCASDRTTFTDGRQIEWGAKRPGTTAPDPQQQGTSSSVVAQTPPAEEAANAIQQPPVAEQPSNPPPSTQQPEAMASSSSTLDHVKLNSVLEQLSIDHAPAPPAVSEGTEADKERMNGMAIAGFATSFFFPVVGIVLSAIALGQIKRKGGRGKGLATAGLIIGIITTILILAAL